MKKNAKKTTKRKLTVTVGIPTCYGGESLVSTVRSLRESSGVKNFRLIIIADRTPIKKSIRNRLTKMGVGLHWNEVEGSQYKKIRQMRATCKTDIFVSTQDDITFRKDTLAEIIKAFEKDSALTMTGARILPLKPISFFESVMGSMLRIVDRISNRWNKGANHLAASGRCLAFRSSHFKKFRLPETVVNGDMFMYLENKRLGGEFNQLKNAIVYIRCPQRLADQVGPSSRYQYQQKEMKGYFDFDFSSEYIIPKAVLIKSTVKEFLSNPLELFLYFFVFVYTRTKKQSKSIVANPVWKVDTSTKKV